ncbi:MAG: secretin N-terminal domain-containing protein [Pseudomonadota bacterium]
MMRARLTHSSDRISRPPVVRLGTTVLCLFIGLILSGCAAQMAYRDGKDLLAHGKVEEGLARFQEALALEPRSPEYKAAAIQTRERLVSSLIEQADRMAEAGKASEAGTLYRRALAFDPSNERVREGLQALEAEQRHAQIMKEADSAWEKKDTDTAQTRLRTILSENPKHAAALNLKRTIAEKTANATPESSLSLAYKKPITIEFKDVAIKQVFEVIARSAGLNFLFDKDVKTDQKTSVFLKNSTIESAVHFTLLTNQLEQQVLDANTILIYPNTAAKLKDYQELIIKTFFLTNAEAKSVANTLKTILKSRDVVVDEKLNMLIVRDTAQAIRLAEKLVALQDVPEPEVMLEVEILEVKRTRLLELGVRWPDSLVLAPLPSATGGPLTLRELRDLNSSTIGVAVPPVTIKARKDDTDTNILANPRIRARNHEKAKILIGERVPNITTTSTATGFASETISYIDVGLKLDVEPTIYLDNDVGIKISLEVSNIVNQFQTKTGSVAYQIGTRNATTVLRLKDGENQVLAGLINDEDRRSANKVPGLGEVPLIGRLFGSTADDSQKTEIVLSITPRLIRNIQRPEAALSEFRSGTDSSFRIRPESVGGVPVIRPPSGNPVMNSVQPPVLPAAIPVVAPAPLQDAAPAGKPQLSWQGPAQLKLGDTFTLQLMMRSDEPVTGMPMVIGFDNRVLQAMSVTEGDFLKQGGARTSFNSRVNPNGQILMTGTRTGDGGATREGYVASITFRSLVQADATLIQLLTVGATGVAGRAVMVPTPAPHVVRVLPP